MLGSQRRARGLLAAGLGLLVVFVLGSCSDTLVTPGSELFKDGAPQFFSSAFDDYLFFDPVLDVGGANDVPAQSDLNAFAYANNIGGSIAVEIVWDDVDSWTGSGQTGDACALFDTTPANATGKDAKGKGMANYAVCVRISNPDGDPDVIAQLESPASPLLYSCGDTKADRCASSVSLLDIDGIVCEVEKKNGETFFAEGDDGADVIARCSIPLSAMQAAVTPNLINVCSYPSGSPQSNPFDCVVIPGAGFLRIAKNTTPDNNGKTFTFTVSPATAGGVANFSITDNSTGANVATASAAAGTNYSITEGTQPTGWTAISASCAFDQPNSPSTGTPGTNSVTGFEIQAGETTICTFDNRVLAPSISVVKTATRATVKETGDTVTYDVVVTNNSTIPVTLTSLIDDKFGDLDGQGTCNSGGNPYGSIAAAGTYSCSFKGTVGASEAGQTHINEVEASVTSDGGPVSAKDTAKVTYSDVSPDISVVKSASQTIINAEGGASPANFNADITFSSNGGGGGGGTTPVFDAGTCDDAGPNDAPAQSDMNCFSRADNVGGRLWLRWTWDSSGQWTGSGQTGDACALLDTDNNGDANFAFCARITNTSDGSQILQVPGSPILYKCKDGAADRCTSKTFIVDLDPSSECTISKVPEHFTGPPSGDDGEDVQAECDLRLADLAPPVVPIANIDLLNVCSFPSGSPNSNPFDCVITPAAGFLVITKSTTPANSASYFGYVLRNAANDANATATNGDDEFLVQGGVTSAAIPILPGTYALTEYMPTGWSLNSISCVKDGQNAAGATSGTTKLGITIVQGQTTTCTFNNVLSASADVEFTVVVTNNSLEAVSLFSLEDSENPTAGTPTYSTLSGVGTCNSGANPYPTSLAKDATYECKFTRTISGSPGFEHEDRVRAVGKDNEDNSDTELSNIVTVTVQ
jgi:hypothetical protein